MATATTAQPGFAELEAQSLPTLACIGRVHKIEGPKETKPNPETGINYLNYTIGLEGYGASRSQRLNLLLRPEWLVEGFNPATFKQIEGGKGLEFMYGRHIRRKGSVSTLQGLVGCDEEKFSELAVALFAAEGDPAGIKSVLEKFLIEDGNGAKVGYILKQQQEKTGEDEDGKPTYAKTQYYEVSSFFTPDEKGRERQYKRAQTAEPGTFRVQFTEDDCPY